MEKGLLYIVALVILMVAVTAGSIKNGFQPARFILSIVALYFIPGLAVALYKGSLFLVHDSGIRLPLLAGLIAGFILHEILHKRLPALATFEHELTHAIAAVFFFRRISKFVVTRNQGGYIESSGGFGGKTGDYFITLAPYFLPTFTLFSVLIRPFLPAQWFPWYDIWIGISFSFQVMSNMAEIKQNWTKRKFRPAHGGVLTHTDIGKEGYIFSFIMIVCLKLLFTGIMFFILWGNYAAIRLWFGYTGDYSYRFFFPVYSHISDFLF